MRHRADLPGRDLVHVASRARLGLDGVGGGFGRAGQDGRRVRSLAQAGTEAIAIRTPQEIHRA